MLVASAPGALARRSLFRWTHEYPWNPPRGSSGSSAARARRNRGSSRLDRHRDSRIDHLPPTANGASARRHTTVIRYGRCRSRTLGQDRPMCRYVEDCVGAERELGPDNHDARSRRGVPVESDARLRLQMPTFATVRAAAGVTPWRGAPGVHLVAPARAHRSGRAWRRCGRRREPRRTRGRGRRSRLGHAGRRRAGLQEVLPSI